jgi:hypothetical protein
MKVVGSSEDGSSEMKVYGTAAAANAAASAQFDKVRRELAKAKERAWNAYHSSEEYGGDYHTYNHDMFNEDEYEDDDMDEGYEFTEFEEEKDADGAACWSWNVTWWECTDEAQLPQCANSAAFPAAAVAHEGFVRVGRVRALAEASN